ncbi:MAG: hypothetical protein RLZZ186_716 [Cyanobacteriota bacterium]|jgi:hypothetical protein
MVEMTLEGWTDCEQEIARTAFNAAYQRSIDRLVLDVRRQCENLDHAESVWKLHDFLSIQRHIIEGRFDFRLDGILFVFASLVKDELLTLSELEGLEAEKLAKITAMARF